MCIFQIYAQCRDKFFEVSADETENAELMVEDAVSLVLLDLFGEGSVDDVTIHFTRNPHTRLQYCSIQVLALCPRHRFIHFPCPDEQIEQVVAQRISNILRELFGSVQISRVALKPMSETSEYDSALSQPR